MTTETDPRRQVDLSLVRAGPAYRLSTYLGLTRPGPRHSLLRISVLVLITWVPLLLLSLLSGLAIGKGTAVPFFDDPEVHARFIFVLPLLELATLVVARSLTLQARQFLAVGIVSEQDSARFHNAQAQIQHIRQSLVAEVGIVVLSYVISVVLRIALDFQTGKSSWEFTGDKVTLAGWWYMLVSLPLLYFLLLRWLWAFLLWACFLFRISRLPLRLTATHPDRAGGLGFVAWGLASFGIVLLAVSAVFSAAFAQEILHHGESLDSLKYHILAYAVLAIAVLNAPLFAFTGQLARCRFQGLLDLGAMAWRYDKAFDEKWIDNPTTTKVESLLGSSDIQAMADMATCYSHVEDMRLFPFDRKAFVALVLAALLPMLPLVATAIPLVDILAKLSSLLI